jgi:hypothetical protein
MTDCKECGKQIAALRTEMLAQMEELKSIIRFAMGGAPGVTPSQQIASLTDGSALRMMTSKQHAAMQMWLFSGMNIANIGRRMKVSRNTARLSLVAVWNKMGTKKRDEISQRLLPIIDAASDAEYMEWSGGLPKNWAATYDAGRIDPYLHLYVKSKDDTYGKRKT